MPSATSLLPRCACVALAWCFNACADVVHLRNGKTLRGEVVKEDDEWIVVKVPYGEVKLRASDVEGIERQTPLEYRIELGRQLMLERQFDRAVRVFEEAYTSDRTNKDARLVLRQRLRRYGETFPWAQPFPRGARNAREAAETRSRRVAGSPHRGPRYSGNQKAGPEPDRKHQPGRCQRGTAGVARSDRCVRKS